MTVTFREKLLAIALAISLIISLGYAVAQVFDPLGQVDVAAVFVKDLPEGIQPLLFVPATLDIGSLREGTFEDFNLRVTNPNAFPLNITWAPQISFALPIQLRLQLGGETFSQNTHMEIPGNGVLLFTARVRAGTCDECPNNSPFTASFVFSGHNTTNILPTINPGTAEFPIQILSVETLGGNGTISYNATYQNVSSESLQLDAVVRREPRNSTFGFEPGDGQAEVLILAAGASEVTSGVFSVLGVTNMVYQLQFEALTPPPGRQLADIVRVDVRLESDPPGVAAPEFIPAGEPEGFVPEAELGDPIGEIQLVGGIVPSELLPAIILMVIIGVAATIGIVWARKSKTAKTKTSLASPPT